ncbi:MAG: hypothetical protein HYV27_21885 [Candidatus Hydrogenedentes bacterium]|nr:hypothetical protein [Candidatus Hydrogenedentota bacterium]
MLGGASVESCHADLFRWETTYYQLIHGAGAVYMGRNGDQHVERFQYVRACRLVL